MATRKIYPRPLEALAAAAGVSKWTLYKDELRGQPTFKTAKAVARVLGVDWTTLFSTEEPVHSDPPVQSAA